VLVEFEGEPTGLRQRSVDVEVVFTLLDTDVGVRNNKNPLNLEHFDVLPKRAQLVPVDSDLELRLLLRHHADLTYEMTRADDGRLVLQIDFPPPKSEAPRTAP